MPVHAASTDTRARLGNETADEHLGRPIRDIEHGLGQEDPDFVRRTRGRADFTHGAKVVVYLVATVILLAVGLASLSWFAFVAGALAFVAASVMDDRYRRTRRPR